MDGVLSEGKPTCKRICKRHPSQELDFYCSVCQEIVCRDCILMDRVHTTHKYNLVSVVASDYRDNVLHKLKAAQKIQSEVTQALEHLPELKERVIAEDSITEAKISTSFDELIEVVCKQKQTLKQTAMDLTSTRLKGINAQEENLKVTRNELHSLVTSMQDTVESLKDEEIVSRGQKLLSTIEETTKKFSGRLPQVPTVEMRLVAPEELATFCMQHSILQIAADPIMCKAQGVNSTTEVNEVNRLSLRVLDSCGYPCTSKQCITAELQSLRYDTVSQAQVTMQDPSHYALSYIPIISTRGRCKLNVKVNGIDINGSPFDVFVKCSPTELGTPVKVIEHVRNPSGLAYAPDGKLFVIKSHKQLAEISVFDSKLEPIDTIQANLPESWWPVELAIDKHCHNIFVTDDYNKQIHVFTSDGVLRKSVGKKGVIQGRFATPNGIEISQSGLLFVCDSDNQRVQVFDTTLNWLKCLNGESRKLNWPSDVDFDKEDHVYITDYGNSEIRVLDQDGNSIRSFGSKDVVHPCCIHIKDELVYVTDDVTGLNCVNVFHSSGKFITRFGKEFLSDPQGITVDEDGFVYVADRSKNCVVIF